MTLNFQASSSAVSFSKDHHRHQQKKRCCTKYRWDLHPPLSLKKKVDDSFALSLSLSLFMRPEANAACMAGVNVMEASQLLEVVFLALYAWDRLPFRACLFRLEAFHHPA